MFELVLAVGIAYIGFIFTSIIVETIEGLCSKLKMKKKHIIITHNVYNTRDALPKNRQSVLWWDVDHSRWQMGTYYTDVINDENPRLSEVSMFTNNQNTHYICRKNTMYNNGDVYWMDTLPSPDLKDYITIYFSHMR